MTDIPTDSLAAKAIGWNADTRSWTRADDALADPLPPLRGRLVTDGPEVDAAGRDVGNIRFARPSAVLVPADVSDITTLVDYCHRHRIPVTPRGTGHATHGQALVDRGVVIDMTALRTVHSIGAEHGADVDAGVLWSTVLHRAAEQDLAFPCLTSYLDLSVAGTLSVGGIGASYAEGPQINHVRAVQVVTGTGETRWCSAEENVDLFEAVLGGLGQYGIITRVVLDLVPKPQAVLTLRSPYLDLDSALTAVVTLVERGEFDQVSCLIIGPQNELPPTYLVIAVAFHDPASPPDHQHLLRDLPAPVAPVEPEHSDYQQHAMQYTVPVDYLREHADWDRQVKPWFDAFVADGDVNQVVGEVVGSMDAEDWSPAGGGFVLLYPFFRTASRRPQLRLPDEDRYRDGAGQRAIVFLFDVLDANPDRPGLVEDKAGRNNNWWTAVAEPRGARRYPIGTLDFGPDDWRRHYGDRWPHVRALKERFDPAGILTRGQHIFEIS